MIGSRVKFNISKYSREHECNIQLTLEGTILDKHISPLKVVNEGVRGMSEAKLNVYIPVNFYLILTNDNVLHNIQCCNIAEIISYKN